MTEDPALTPTELALLNGDRFAAKKMMRNVRLLDGERKVSAVDLGTTLLALAVLANERNGALRLEPRRRKALLGALGMQKLWVDPTPRTAAWPSGTLEARVEEVARRLAASGRNDAESVLVDVLATETHDAYAHAVDLVKAGLHARGLLVAEGKKALGLIPYKELRAPAPLLDAARNRDLADVQAALAAGEARPDVWKLLRGDIKDAATRQTTQPDGPD